MALKYQDPMSLWGTGSTGRTNATRSQNGFLSIPTSFDFTNANPRISGGWSLRYTNDAVHAGNGGAIFSLGGATAGPIGVAFAVCPQTVPALAMETGAGLFQFYQLSQAGGVRCRPNLDGSLSYVRVATNGGETTLLTTPSGVLIGTVYTVVATELTVHDTAGRIRVWVNGTMVSDSGATLDTNASEGLVSTVGLIPARTARLGNVDFTDLFVWDTTGVKLTAYPGNKVSKPVFLDSTVANTMTVTGAATAHEAVDEQAPNDDTDYLRATAAGQSAELGVAAVDSSLTGIVAATLMVTQRLESPGDSTARAGLKSGATTDWGTTRNPAYPAWTTYFDHFYADPDSGDDLDPTNLSAMSVVLERVS